MRKTDLAYVAGVIDGEGCISICRDKNLTRKSGYQYVLRVTVGSTDEWLPCWLKFAFGGNIYSRQPRNPKWQRVWVWEVATNKAKDCLEAILPYLRLKRPQAEVAIQFQRAKHKGLHKTTEEALVEEAQTILVKSMKRKKGLW